MRNGIRTVEAVLLLTALALGPLSSNAAVITFDNILPSTPSTPCFGDIPACPSLFLDVDGYRFASPDNGVSNHAHVLSAPYVQGVEAYASNGTQFIGLDSALITMTHLAGASFALQGLDIAEGYLLEGAARGFASQLRIEGQLLGGGQVSATYDFDGINDGVGGVADFQSISLPNTFVGLASVRFIGLDADGQPGFAFVNLDNISVTAVPEPASASMLLTALGLIGCFARLKQRLHRQRRLAADDSRSGIGSNEIRMSATAGGATTDGAGI